ncbi:MAG: hypothetical protein NC086_02740, partial [Alistipes sp.]|nr:hypothetical protein [Alistipes sp.]
NFTGEDYRILVSCEKQWELDENGFPTGKRISPPDGYNNGIMPLAAPLADHLQADMLPENGSSPFHTAMIRNIKTGTELIYETDRIFANWMVWNKRASDNFVCIEPMTCIIDAPNATIPQDLHGFTTLKPGGRWSAKNRLYVRS